jgi:nucleoside-diphosphate-sugar epimerase
VVTAAAGYLGSRVCRLAAADPDVEEAIALDPVRPADLPAKVRWCEASASTATESQLADVFGGATTVIHLAVGDPLAPDGDPSYAATAERVLRAAEKVGVDHVILRSSAAVYGAWSDNPIPLSESAPLRPNPGAGWVNVRAEIERHAVEFRGDHPGLALTVLRPCATVAAEGLDGISRVLAAIRRTPVGDGAPVQYLDVDDLASAVDHARRERLDGAFNVAPEGWLEPDMVRALAGGQPRVRLGRFTKAAAALRWRWRTAPTPPELLPFASEPWVVASDRLRATGWTPESSCEEAFVLGHQPTPWGQISPRRRQELALAVAAVGVAGAAAGTVWAVRRLRHR